jgi:hypothetical protein
MASSVLNNYASDNVSAHSYASNTRPLNAASLTLQYSHQRMASALIPLSFVSDFPLHTGTPFR